MWKGKVAEWENAAYYEDQVDKGNVGLDDLFILFCVVSLSVQVLSIDQIDISAIRQ